MVVIDNNGSVSYVRKNGDYIIGLSISYDKSNIMISVFDVTGQEKLLNLESFLENSTPQSAQYSEQTKQKLENLRAEEKERNEFSEMIEAIVNSKKLSTYYHNRDMFILSSGLFRDDLEVKYGNKDMLILAMPLDGITDYIEFTRQTFDGETDHPVIFEFNIRKKDVLVVLHSTMKKGNGCLIQYKLLKIKLFTDYRLQPFRRLYRSLVF